MVTKASVFFRENVVKNILIVVLAALAYRPFSEKLSAVDSSQLNNLLLVISIFLVTVCFANFAFTYEKTDPAVFLSRFIAHLATFVFMLLTALLLEAMVVAVGTVYPPLYSLTLGFSAVLYFGIAVYDFWDLFRLNLR